MLNFDKACVIRAKEFPITVKLDQREEKKKKKKRAVPGLNNLTRPSTSMQNCSSLKVCSS
jgi:hypothetical protein